ncbi:GyrI-like domain-containing protein [Chromobacterium sp. IIBBL 290-4]|uniref:AraC family transcriptional regulator n=1 Tax=Chromobacterium sp. IIBBL 290-4 TaxID=2953890 RepID=UPI0020B695E4|nr:AraC family transcriptional regulator [Chromobacterium sp. IIBBL 290-4]UTH74780.1 AraC family transcriptional regulator [Chromobacterium sp. IIBBL 290-4]
MRHAYRQFGPGALYTIRLLRALDYLWRHLDQPLLLDRLAEEACFSRFHFHRLYRNLMGETVMDSRQRLLLHRAAGELSQDVLPLSRVALRAGFSSTAAFIRAFSAKYGETPGRYRQRRLIFLNHNRESAMGQVAIVKRAAVKVLMRHHQGPYMEIGKAFDALRAALGPEQSALSPSAFGLYLDDPGQTAPSELRSIACAALPEGLAEPRMDGFECGEIPAGRYAVLEHIGPYAELSERWDWLYRHWLPDSGEQPGTVPCAEEYLNSPYDTPPAQLRTLLLLSLA